MDVGDEEEDGTDRLRKEEDESLTGGMTMGLDADKNEAALSMPTISNSVGYDDVIEGTWKLLGKPGIGLVLVSAIAMLLSTFVLPQSSLWVKGVFERLPDASGWWNSASGMKKIPFWESFPCNYTDIGTAYTASGCGNYTSGRWVFDPKKPLPYTSCPMSFKRNCSRDGRENDTYQHWRWQPYTCQIPDFSVRRFAQALHCLKKKRLWRNGGSMPDGDGDAAAAAADGGGGGGGSAKNGRSIAEDDDGDGDEERGEANDFAALAFVGDSLGENMFASLGCMIYEQYGPPTKYEIHHHMSVVEWAGELQIRLHLFWAPYLVRLQDENNGPEIPGEMERPSRAAPASAGPGGEGGGGGDRERWWELHVDRLASNWVERMHSVDVLVFDSGHWWGSSKLRRRKIRFAQGGFPAQKMTKDAAIGLAVRRVADYMREVMRNGSFRGQAYFRSLSPAHFTRGDWNTGGRCDANLPLTEQQMAYYSKRRRRNSHAVKAEREWRRAMELCPECQLGYVDISDLSDFRVDAHPSKFVWKRALGGGGGGGEDCSHWCLPGVPDTWNELLLLLMEMHLAK